MSAVEPTLYDEYSYADQPPAPTKVKASLSGSDRFRVAAHVLMASLPSRVLAQTPRGNALGRRRMTEVRDRRHKGDAAVRKRTEVDDDLLLRKGFKLDYDDDQVYDELDRIKQLESIKAMPVSIAVKRQLRQKVFDSLPDAKSDDCCQTCSYTMKLDRLRCHLQSKLCCIEMDNFFTLWSIPFKSIEGHFGSGVLTYFKLLKQLFLLNFLIFLLSFFFIILPNVVFPHLNYTATVTGSSNWTALEQRAFTCSALYQVNTSSDVVSVFLEWLGGTGFMEKTMAFYGHYEGRELSVFQTTFQYNMPLAYLLVTVLIYLFSLIAVVYMTSAGFRAKLFSNEDSLKGYCNKVFGSWDYTLEHTKSACIKHKSVYREICNDLHVERNRAMRHAMERGELCRMYTVRIIINLIVLAILAGCGYLIYFTTESTTQMVNSAAFSTYSKLVQFLIQYMTSVTITALNFVSAVVFEKIVQAEKYTPSIQLNVTLGRTVFLRLASVAVVLVTLYTSVMCGTKDAECNVSYNNGTCSSLRCWENNVGQEMYKLVITNFIVVIGVTLFVEFPRKLIVSKCKCKLTRLVGVQEFNISKNVLDLVYLQTLVWLGIFYCPMLGGMAMVSNFIVFYLKWASLSVNMRPPRRHISMCDTHSFQVVLLLSSCLAAMVPNLYTIWEMTPSRGCGPFRMCSLIYDIVPFTVSSFPSVFKEVFQFIGSAACIYPLIIALVLVIFYTCTGNRTLHAMTRVLREQLYLEGTDKQFLLARIQVLNEKLNPDMKKNKSVKCSPLEVFNNNKGPLPKAGLDLSPPCSPSSPGSVVILDGTSIRHVSTPPGVPLDLKW